MRKAIRILKDGYWDQTAVVEHNGGFRVRKCSKETENPGPWALSALREEIRYLETLPEGACGVFPELLEAYDDGTQAGYEMPYYDDFQDVASLLHEGALDQEEADRVVSALSGVIFDLVHREKRGEADLFFAHVRRVVGDAAETLSRDERFAHFVDSAAVVVNGEAMPGIRASLSALPTVPIKMVRLHGDLILENVLWNGVRPILVDPVSVAGIWEGPPEFDLVKHVSYASGELFAIREEHVDLREDGSGGWLWKECRDAPDLAPFRETDLCSGFKAAFEERHGPPDRRLCHLIDGYFSMAMAVNTTGRQQWVRVLKAVEELGMAVKLAA